MYGMYVSEIDRYKKTHTHLHIHIHTHKHKHTHSLFLSLSHTHTLAHTHSLSHISILATKRRPRLAKSQCRTQEPWRTLSV